MFGNNIVKNGRIHQEIKWNAPVLRQNKFPEYTIRYADSRRNRSKQSSVPNTTLQLTFSTTNITYYIRVAVRSAGDQKRGDFSDPVSITYTSEFVCRLAELNTSLCCMIIQNPLARWGSNLLLSYIQNALWGKGIHSYVKFMMCGIAIETHSSRSTHTLCHTHHTLSFITAPGLPQNLTPVNRTCHSITFQWSPPDDTGRLDVTGYDILHNGTPVPTITGTVYTLEGLTPDTVHTISVRTRNAIGPSVLLRTLTVATGERGTYAYTVLVSSVALVHRCRTTQYIHVSQKFTTVHSKQHISMYFFIASIPHLPIEKCNYIVLLPPIVDKPLIVTSETMSSRSINIGVFPPLPQTGRLHYKCNLTTEDSDSVQMLSLNETKDTSPYNAVKGLSPYTNYTATCWVLKDGVDQCYIGSNTTQTYTDGKL